VLCTWLEKGLRRTIPSGPNFLIWRLSARAIWPSRVAWHERTVRPRERCQISNRLSCATRGVFGLLQRPFSIPRPLGVVLYYCRGVLPGVACQRRAANALTSAAQRLTVPQGLARAAELSLCAEASFWEWPRVDDKPPAFKQSPGQFTVLRTRRGLREQIRVSTHDWLGGHQRGRAQA